MCGTHAFRPLCAYIVSQCIKAFQVLLNKFGIRFVTMVVFTGCSVYILHSIWLSLAWSLCLPHYPECFVLHRMRRGLWCHLSLKRAGINVPMARQRATLPSSLVGPSTVVSCFYNFTKRLMKLFNWFSFQTSRCLQLPSMSLGAFQISAATHHPPHWRQKMPPHAG